MNSISPMPSPVYQWRNVLRRNMAVNCSATRFQVSWIAFELPREVVGLFGPFGGMSQIGDLALFGIHSAKCDELLLTTFSICSSTSLVDMRPRKRHEHVR